MPGRGQAGWIRRQRREVSRGERQPAARRGNCDHVTHAKARRQKALVERAVGRRKKAKVDLWTALQLLRCNQIRQRLSGVGMDKIHSGPCSIKPLRLVLYLVGDVGRHLHNWVESKVRVGVWTLLLQAIEISAR